MQKPNILKFIFFVVLGVGIYFTLLNYLLEFESRIENPQIKDWEDAFWYSTVTLTTVGYGDIVPQTPSGRAIGSVFILFSLGIYGLLIGQISSILGTIKETRRLGMHGTTFTNHVVIIGWNDFGKAVTDQLVAAKRNVAIVTRDKDNIDIINEYYGGKNVFTLFSDYNNIEILAKVNIEQSSTVFINLNDDTEKLVYILNLKKQYKNITFIVTLDNANLKSTFMSAGVTYAISRHEISSKLLASYIFEPDVALYSEEIISYPISDEDNDIKQFVVVEGNQYVGSYYDKAFFDLKKQCNAVLIGIVKRENGKKVLYKNPEESIKIDQGDYLLMISNGKSEKILSKIFDTKEGV